MSLVLPPQGQFTVVRQIANHLDTDTNFVRAVIRNAYTDAIIDTLDLIDKGSQRFSKNWQVPADPSGQGFFISIVTSVYTDSGYTSKNPNYGDEENTYLVQDRLMHLGSGGGGIDAYTVRRILQEELDKRQPEDVEPIEFPEIPKYEMRWDEVLKAIQLLGTKTDAIPTEKTNLKPVLDAVAKAAKAIEAKEVTPATDIDPILSKLDDHKEAVEISAKDLKNAFHELHSSLVDSFASVIAAALKRIEFTSTVTTEPRVIPRESDKPQLSPIDISKLSA